MEDIIFQGKVLGDNGYHIIEISKDIVRTLNNGLKFYLDRSAVPSSSVVLGSNNNRSVVLTIPRKPLADLNLLCLGRNPRESELLECDPQFNPICGVPSAIVDYAPINTDVLHSAFGKDVGKKLYAALRAPNMRTMSNIDILNHDSVKKYVVSVIHDIVITHVAMRQRNMPGFPTVVIDSVLREEHQKESELLAAVIRQSEIDYKQEVSSRNAKALQGLEANTWESLMKKTAMTHCSLHADHDFIPHAVTQESLMKRTFMKNCSFYADKDFIANTPNIKCLCRCYDIVLVVEANYWLGLGLAYNYGSDDLQHGECLMNVLRIIYLSLHDQKISDAEHKTLDELLGNHNNELLQEALNKYCQSKGTVLDSKGTVLDSKGAVLESKGTVLVDSKGAVLDSKGTVLDSKGTVLDSKGAVLDSKGTVLDFMNNSDVIKESVISMAMNIMKSPVPTEEMRMSSDDCRSPSSRPSSSVTSSLSADLECESVAPSMELLCKSDVVKDAPPTNSY